MVRARDDDQPVLAVTIGDQIDVAGLVRHGDRTELSEGLVGALGLAEGEDRGGLVPAYLCAVGIDGVGVAERGAEGEVGAFDPLHGGAGVAAEFVGGDA